MPPHHQHKHHFVTITQQLLALGLVVAALTPAASVVSLTVRPDPGTAGITTLPSSVPSMAAYTRASAMTSEVPAEVVEAEVVEHQLTAPANARLAPGKLEASSSVERSGSTEIVSDPQPVTGYGAVGITWQHGVELGEDEVEVEVRTSEDGAWTDWTPLDYHDEHGPDPESAEGQQARPGTEPLLVGDVDEVQVRVESSEAAPPDLSLAVIDPGTAAETVEEAPAIDTAELAANAEASAADVPPGAGEPVAGTEDALALQAGAVTPKPRIFSRQQWGADESLRSRSSLRYFEVHAGFVHHTVNANAYTKAQVPGILRSIYAYHTRSRGWSDVGYNFLVDRFGRIWEGRAGGVDRPVVGAHTLGYNDYSFAMSAIGNFDIAKPTKAIVQAYGALMAWKLSLHGVSASDASQQVGSRRFPAINGHRDAGSTACPGRYLYAKLGKIKRLAAKAQVGWAGRQLESQIARSPHPDLIARRVSDGQAMVLTVRARKNGTYWLRKPKPTGVDVSGANRILNAGDWDGDGNTDLIARSKATGALTFRPGNGSGGYGAIGWTANGFKKVRLLAAVGDITGDGRPDLMGQPKGSSMRIYPGLGSGGVGSGYVAHSAIKAQEAIPLGLWDADGSPDVAYRSGQSTLTLYPGNGPGGLVSPRRLNFSVAGFNRMVGISDVGLTGTPDIIARSKANNRLYLLPGNSGGFGAPVLIGSSDGLNLLN